MSLTRFLATAPPDGYTLFVGASGVMSIATAAYPNLAYHPTRSFIPLSMIANFPLIMVSPVTLAPKQKVTLAPGGAYVGLLDIKKHLEVGWGLEMTLVFEKAGEVVIDAAIDAPDAKHAHDAEAMERWEKAHGKDNAGKH